MRPSVPAQRRSIRWDVILAALDARLGVLGRRRSVEGSRIPSSGLARSHPELGPGTMDDGPSTMAFFLERTKARDNSRRRLQGQDHVLTRSMKVRRGHLRSALNVSRLPHQTEQGSCGQVGWADRETFRG